MTLLPLTSLRCRAGLPLVLGLTFWVSSSAALSGGQSAEKADEAAASANLSRRLLRKVTVAAEKTPLDRLIAGLAKEHGLPIVIDEPTLTANKVSVESPVTLHAAGISLRSALHLILGPLKLATVSHEGKLTVTTRARADEETESRRYDVRRLAAGDDYAPLIAMFEALSKGEGAHAFWAEAIPDAGMIEIDWPPALHDEVPRLLFELERRLAAPGGSPSPPAPDPIRDAERALRMKLAGPCDLKCDNEPLDATLKRFAVGHALPLWIDPALYEVSDPYRFRPDRASVTFDLRGVRLESALSHILGRNLLWDIEDEMLKVSAQYLDRSLEIAIHDVRDFQGRAPLIWENKPTEEKRALAKARGRDPRSEVDAPLLIAAIQATIEPADWSENSGAGAIGSYRGLLVVRQNALIQRQIVDLLDDLRAARLRQPPQPASVAEAPARLTLVVYDLDQTAPSPRRLAELISKEVAPASWKAAGGEGTIAVGPASLAVRQSAEVHQEIVELLHRRVRSNWRPRAGMGFMGIGPP